MRLWSRKPSGEEPEPVSDIARLEELLHRLSDDIAEHERGDQSPVSWSSMLRTCAAQVGAGQPAGLEGFFRLFSSDPRNTINEQPFARTRTFYEASRLATKLLNEHNAEEDRLREGERGLVLRPWREGSTGKALVFADGTVHTSDDDAPGTPQFVDLQSAFGKQSGDVSAALLAVSSQSTVDLLWGVGGTPEGVIAAAAIKCTGGQQIGRLWPRTGEERTAALDAGYDLERQLTVDDLVASDDCFFSATGVTDGDVLEGVHFRDSGAATTESLVMRGRSGTVRRIGATHDRNKLRSYGFPV